MLKIERKSLLYKSGVEYADFCLNHVEGCAHGCKFPCYAFQMAKRFGKVKTYSDWIKPKLVSNKIHNRHKSDSSLYQEQEISIMKAKSFNTQKVISNTPNYATPIILGITVVYAVIGLFL